MTNPFRQDRPANTTLPQTVSSDTPFDQGIAENPINAAAPEKTRRRKQVKFDTTYEDIDAEPPTQQEPSFSSAGAHQDLPAHPNFPSDVIQERVQEQELDSEDDNNGPEVVGGSIYRPSVQADVSTEIPPNPFARTLAAMEPTDSQNADYATRSHPRVDAAKEGGSNRASLDVDAFTQMLLGRTTKPNSSDLTPPRADGSAERKLSQDSDSVRSPRSSLDQMRLSNAGKDSPSLGASSDKPSKPKPPPPRHRHGKAVSESKTPDVVSPGPQVVSFDDFAASFSNTTHAQSTQPSSHRNSLNLSQRPLPAPPPPSHHHGHAISTIPSSPSTESLQSTEGAKSAKKQAPPPPIARRSSNLRHEVSSSSTSRQRSGTASSMMSEENDEDTGLMSPRTAAVSESSAKVPPPPPPARRSGAHRDSTSMPILQRQGSAASSISQRPGSSASMTAPRDRSTSQVSQSSNHGMVPPPPPPPRRTSSRSSISNSARTSVDLTATAGVRNSIEAPRRTSAEIRRSSAEMRRASNSSQKGAAPYASRTGGGEVIDEEAIQDAGDDDIRLTGTESNNRSSKDVLADMDAFQREIDELRSKYAQQNPPVIDTRVDQA